MTPWTVAHQASLSLKFPRQESRSGLPFPSPGDLPDAGIQSVSPELLAWSGGFFTTGPLGKPLSVHVGYLELENRVKEGKY